MQTISELRSQTQIDLVEPPVYRPFRAASIYVTWVVTRTPATPNLVTVVWALCLFGAGWALASAPANLVLAEALLVAYYVLDCVDGELARARNIGSKLGSQLEQICHWLTNGVLLAGIGLGQLHHDKDHISTLLWTAAAIIGDYTFHFTYYQINLLFNRGLNYGRLHLLTRILYLGMPINTNLLLVAIPFGLHWPALQSWAILTNITWPTVFALYYFVEVEAIARERTRAEAPPALPSAPKNE